MPVKADGYGHGAVRIAVEALKNGASYLAVATVGEAAELRSAGIVAPVLLLSLPSIREIPDMLDASVTPLVFDEEFIGSLHETVLERNANSGGKQICCPVHLAVDTGMGRVGCRPEQAADIACLISRKSGLRLDGICTHLSVSDSLNENDMAYTRLQIEKFRTSVESIKQRGIDPGIVHCAASGGIMMYPESHFDMVRPGIIAYGFAPDKSVLSYLSEKGTLTGQLKPVMDFTSSVVAVIPHKKGDAISYGREWIAGRDTDIAVLPVGYADGLLRRFSPGLEVLINGTRYPVVGRICMDQCMVDIGKNHGISRGDTAIIFGCTDGFQTAEDLASRIGTIPYEILCGIDKRVPRIYG